MKVMLCFVYLVVPARHPHKMKTIQPIMANWYWGDASRYVRLLIAVVAITVAAAVAATVAAVQEVIML